MVQGGQHSHSDPAPERELSGPGEPVDLGPQAPPHLGDLLEPTDAMFRVIAEQSLFPITLLDDQGVVRWVGWSYERIFGWQPDELIGHGFDRVIAPHSLDAAIEAFAHVDEAYEPAPWGGVGLQVDLLRADGTCVPCEIAAVTRKRSGLPWYLVFARQAGYERALDQAVEAMASGASLGEVLTTVVAALERMVPEATIVIGDRWSGESFDVTAGRAATLLQPHPSSPWARAMQSGADQHADCDDLPAPLASLARAEGLAACWVHPISVGADDRPEAAVIAWRPFAGPPQRFSRLTIDRGGQLLRLVLQWDRSQRMLEFAATHDPLTGLANRQSFRDRLATVSRAREGRAAVLYLDLDRFKPVNDELGHAAGDRVLTTVAERLVTALRPGDMVARMGGDEFAVLCERLTKPDDVERVADRLLATIRRPIAQLPGGEVTIDASIGIADVAGGERVDALLARSDDAMRTAKQSGRARWTRSG